MLGKTDTHTVELIMKHFQLLDVNNDRVLDAQDIRLAKKHNMQHMHGDVFAEAKRRHTLIKAEARQKRRSISMSITSKASLLSSGSRSPLRAARSGTPLSAASLSEALSDLDQDGADNQTQHQRTRSIPGLATVSAAHRHHVSVTSTGSSSSTKAQTPNFLGVSNSTIGAMPL